MGGQYGIDQIKKVAFFGLAFGQALEKSVHESSTFGRAAAFLSAVDEAAVLFTLDRDLLKKEFGELDASDRDELFMACAEEFKLEDKDLETKVEQSVAAGFEFLAAAEKLVKIWKVKEVAQP